LAYNAGLREGPLTKIIQLQMRTVRWIGCISCSCSMYTSPKKETLPDPRRDNTQPVFARRSHIAKCAWNADM